MVPFGEMGNFSIAKMQETFVTKNKTPHACGKALLFKTLIKTVKDVTLIFSQGTWLWDLKEGLPYCNFYEKMSSRILKFHQVEFQNLSELIDDH